MKSYSWLLLCLISLQMNAQSAPEAFFDQKFPSNQLQEDIKVLRTGLEKIHPGLYRYTEVKVMDSLFNKLQGKLEVGSNYQEFYREVCQLVAKIKCQHTVAAPAPDELNQIVKEGQFFPLRVFWEFDPVKAYATFDFSSEANLPPGTRIVGINSQSMEDIYSKLIPYFSSDGDILSNKHSRLQVGTDFQFWYYLLLGRPKTFTVVLKGTNGEKFTKIYDAVTWSQWTKNHKTYLSQKNPKIRKYLHHYKTAGKRNRSKPIRLEFLSDDIAMLTVGNFDSHKFESIISKAFEKIKIKKVKNLIIDVRYNEGGSDILGRHLSSHLISRPIIYFDSLYTSAGISDTTFLFAHTDKNAEWMEQVRPLVSQLPDGRFATKPEVNQGLLLQQPSENTFKGSVYVLMNGRSASTTAEFTSVLHFNERAVFIGEESGGAYHGGHGGDFAQLRLPNTKITVHVPLSKYVMNGKETRFIGRGTLPDHPVETTMKDILDLRDSQLDFAIKLIMEK